MIILPAIDIKDGNCVRLIKGDFATVHKVFESPIKAAEFFANASVQWLHMVDLDGAKTGATINRETILDVVKNTKIKVELGGGIRDINTVDDYINNGISRVILGSAALKNPDFVKETVKKYNDKIAVGIDALDGFVATEGWIESSKVNYIEFAKKMEQIGVKCIIFTDISRDGTLQGPAVEGLYRLKEAISCNIIASGGIKDIQNIKDLLSLKIYGAICGKSIYSGTLDLKEAISVCNFSI
jgi:phosphoribosylformimino-5-aminoimidazole carboxamide ribotide isomerase